MSCKIKIDSVDVDATTVLKKVLDVVAMGQVSEAAGIKHYCWVSKFTDGVVVCVRRKRKQDSADSFWVYREQE